MDIEFEDIFAWPPIGDNEAIGDLTAEILWSVAALILLAVQAATESARNAAREIDIDLDFTIDTDPFDGELPDFAFVFAIA